VATWPIPVTVSPRPTPWPRRMILNHLRALRASFCQRDERIGSTPRFGEEVGKGRYLLQDCQWPLHPLGHLDEHLPAASAGPELDLDGIGFGSRDCRHNVGQPRPKLSGDGLASAGVRSPRASARDAGTMSDRAIFSTPRLNLLIARPARRRSTGATCGLDGAPTRRGEPAAGCAPPRPAPAPSDRREWPAAGARPDHLRRSTGDASHVKVMAGRRRR